MTIARAGGVALALAWAGCGPRAEPDDLLASRASIVGGSRVEEGAWPAVVWLEAGCSGVVVHPEVVLYAGHCGASVERVWVGEDATAGRAVATSRCALYPGGSAGGGDDLAYCVLAEPLAEARPIMPAFGCELAAVAAGSPATLVGFGLEGDDAAGAGIKRSVVSMISEVGDELVIGDPSAGTCAGDSGGPALVQVPSGPGDAGWRAVGVLSTGLKDGCGLGYYTRIERFVGWLQAETKRRIVPCFDAAGAWAPTAACRASGLGEQGQPTEAPDEPELATTCGDPYVAEDYAAASGCSFDGRPRRGAWTLLLLGAAARRVGRARSRLSRT